MKKEDVSGIFAYLIILVIAILFGLLILRNYQPNSGLQTGQYIGFVLGAILSSIVFHGIIFEVAHILGAKAGRYTILSTCILGLMFFKQDKKWKVKFGNFDGLTGETKILPKEGEKPSNPTPFLIFGTLFYGIEMLIIIPLFSYLKGLGAPQPMLSNVAYFLLTVGTVGGMIWIYNILPFRLDTMTDGYRLTMVSNPKNKEAFNELLRVENEIANGKTDVEIKTFTSITKFTMELNLNKVYMLLDKKEYLEAEKLVDVILENGTDLAPKLYLRAKAQKIYINIFTKTLEEAKEYYEKSVPVSDRREISLDYSMPSIRAYILMAGLLDKSKSETFLSLNKVNRAFKATPKQRQVTEASLFNDALKKVIEVHPEWELQDFLIEVK